MKIIAFYLPQFHRIPENDQWWGEGFTEWTNTRRARPLFAGHKQPREPLGNNYYDLTDEAARRWQANIAKKHGIYGFCYYHYWFNGKLLLEKPLQEVYRLREPDFPYCMCWANEPWTRAWDGNERQVLMPQTYGDHTDWKRHFEYLLPFFQDNRYITVDGRPIFIIYRSASIDRCDEMLRYWSELGKEAGLPGIIFVEMLTSFESGKNQRSCVFDAQIEMEPQYTLSHRKWLWKIYSGIALAERLFYSLKTGIKFVDSIKQKLDKLRYIIPQPGIRLSYDLLWKIILNRPIKPNRYLGAFVDWDNSPRKGKRGLVIEGATPEKFGKYLKEQIIRARKNRVPFVFINAWNEWAEGAYLEPDKRFKFQYLQEIQKIVISLNSNIK